MRAYKQPSFNFGLASSQKFLFEVKKLNALNKINETTFQMLQPDEADLPSYYVMGVFC
jgi:hypothetical protein